LKFTTSVSDDILLAEPQLVGSELVVGEALEEQELIGKEISGEEVKEELGETKLIIKETAVEGVEDELMEKESLVEDELMEKESLVEDELVEEKVTGVIREKLAEGELSNDELLEGEFLEGRVFEKKSLVCYFVNPQLTVNNEFFMFDGFDFKVIPLYTLFSATWTIDTKASRELYDYFFILAHSFNGFAYETTDVPASVHPFHSKRIFFNLYIKITVSSELSIEIEE
jgi:hypothetical protein